MSKNNLVILFKSLDSEESKKSDDLSLLLSSRGIETRIVSPLVFKKVHGPALHLALEHIHKSRLDGLHCAIVVTSPRAAQILADEIVTGGIFNKETDETILPIFTSGFRTASVLRDVVKANGPALQVISPSDDDKGEGGGGSGALIPQLRRFFSGKVRGKKVLFIRGDRALRAIPDALSEDGIAVDEVIVYESAPESPLNLQISCSSSVVIEGEKRSPSALVFYSPSGLEAVLAANCEDLNMRLSGLGENKQNAAAIFAIGSTTAAALESKGFHVTGVAETPGHISLADIISKTLITT